MQIPDLKLADLVFRNLFKRVYFIFAEVTAVWWRGEKKTQIRPKICQSNEKHGVREYNLVQLINNPLMSGLISSRRNKNHCFCFHINGSMFICINRKQTPRRKAHISF